MREGTSGFWLEETAEEIRIGYEDYGVSEFGGGDFEKTYVIKGENAEKFKAALAAEYSGSLKKMVEAAFGKNFRDPDFWSFCKSRGIEYSSFSWTS